MRLRFLLLSALITAALAAAEPGVQRAVFGQMPDGTSMDVFTLTNGSGATAKVIPFGAILADLRMPDRQGKFVSVVREITPTPENFQRGFPQAGAVMGRVTNRIAQGRFTLDGREVNVTINARPHHIHGGAKGFGKVMWQATPLAATKDPAVRLTYVSAAGEEGYPGKLTATVRYTLTETNTLRIEYSATTDAPTPVNLTNHAYFNLAGGGDVIEQELTINADRITASDALLIPTGEFSWVEGTPLDFRKPAKLGARAAQLGARRIYDHNFVLNRKGGDAALMLAARASDSASGRVMETWTTEPALQLYTSDLGGELPPGRAGFFCLETQHHPDSVNHAHFPSTILRPGETYRSTTEFRFSVR
ncbi:MAG TPA: aldose epimerase family protein [Opitutaceae bacterium]|nr:aldose epimerase family protein [Opitutaceae bacterium]